MVLIPKKVLVQSVLLALEQVQFKKRRVHAAMVFKVAAVRFPLFPTTPACMHQLSRFGLRKPGGLPRLFDFLHGRNAVSVFVFAAIWMVDH